LKKDRLEGKKLIKGLIFSLLIGIAVFLVVFLFTIDKNTLKSFQHMDEEFLWLAVIAVFLSVIVEGLRIQVTARAIGEKIGFWQSVKVFYISFFLGGITPYYSGTLPAQILLYSKNGICIGKGTMIATLRPIIKTIIFMISTPIIFLYFDDSLDKYLEDFEVLSWFVLFIAVIFSLLLIIIFILIMKSPGKIKDFVQWIKKYHFFEKYLNTPKIKEKIEKLFFQVNQFHNSYNLLLSHPGEVALIFVYTALYWLLYFSIAPLLLLAMDIQLNFLLVIIIQVIIFFLLPFLPTPGGSGAAEIGFASLFSFFVPAHLLGIYVGGWRLFTFYLNILIGAILSLTVLKKYISWDDEIKKAEC